MKLSLATTTLTLLSTSARAFQLSSSHTVLGRPNLTRRYILAGTESASDRVAKVFQGRPEENDAMDELVKKNFPGAISNKELETKVVKILDAKYEKSDLKAVVSNHCGHLTNSNQEKLLKLLTEFEDLFDGTLGDWDTEPVSLKLKEGAKPYHGRPYPTPKVHQPTLKKEVKRLCWLGVLK